MKSGFSPISIEKFIKSFVKNNPKQDPKELREALLDTLKDYQEGVKCYCGNDIWVIGSAITGNACFTCITGEAYPESDYEIKEALPY